MTAAPGNFGGYADGGRMSRPPSDQGFYGLNKPFIGLTDGLLTYVAECHRLSRGTTGRRRGPRPVPWPGGGPAVPRSYECGQVSRYSEMFLSLLGAGHRNCS